MVCPSLCRTEQFCKGEEEGEKVQRKGGGRGVASKGGQKEQGRVKTGQNKYHPNRNGLLV